MNRVLVAALTLVTLVATQASAQVATFHSLSLPFSNTILTTAQYNQVLESANSYSIPTEESSTQTKKHLAILPATGYMFGDNTIGITTAIVTQPTTELEPMAVALQEWVNQELILQQSKRRRKR
jgi:hypothetical protein